MDKKNKKKWLKMQIIFFDIILLSFISFILIDESLNWYLYKHEMPCRKKKYFPLIALAFILLAGCAGNQTPTQKNKIPDSGQPQIYHEIETSFTSEDDLGFLDREIKRLQGEGETFWRDQNHKIAGRMPMYHLHEKFECKNGGKENCSIVGLQAHQNNLPPEFKINKCKASGWCLITEPEFPKDIANKLVISMVEFYGFGKDIYTIGTTGDMNGDMNYDENYSIFKNKEEIFSHKMWFGTESVLEDASIVLNSPAFTFYDLKERKDENHPVVNRNIWYNGETLNEKYGVEASSYLFSFQDKTGFVGERDGEKFFFFNGQKISQDFDEIITHSCCMTFSYPIEIDENGILFFLAKRGKKYFLAEINLNKYLK